MFNNWKMPSVDEINLEWKLEYVNKNLGRMCNGAFDKFDDFKKAVMKAEKVIITPAEDRKIEYRSHTRSKEELINLIKGYRSYPEFRNEKTIQTLYDRFSTNLPMNMPMVLEFANGKRRVFGGNTRLDVCFQLGINPKVLLIKVPA